VTQPGRLDHLTPEQKRALLEQLLRKKAAASESAHELSHGQLALWFLHRLAPESASYNVPLAWWIRSDVDPDALREAFQGLAERHAVLRTAFVEEDGQPRRRVQGDHVVAFEVIDASGWSEADLRTRVDELAHRPFDLGDGHPLHVHLLRRAAGGHVLLMVFHHIVYDLWSGMTVLGDLRELYRAALAGVPADLPAPAGDYGDFARWQSAMLASPEAESHWAYWSERLRQDGAVPVLDLPTDRPRPPVQTHVGASLKRRLPPELVTRLRAFARAEGATPFTVLLSAYQILLRRYSGQDELIVGSPMTGRSRPEFEGVVGYFLNTLPLRADFARDVPYRAFLDQVRATVQGALRHQDFPADLLAARLNLARDPSQTPLFQTMFVYNRAHSLAGRAVSVSVLGDTTDLRVEMSPLVLETFPLEQRTSIVDLALTVHESDAALAATWQFNADLFREDTIARMAGQLEALLDELTRRPDALVDELELLSPGERETLVHGWNDRTRVERSGETLPALFARQAARAPERVAVVFESRSITYGELADRSDRLAAALRARGVGRGHLVGIFTHRGVEMVIGLLAVLKARAAYVPMDPAYPPDRLAFMLSDSGASLVLTERRLASAVPADGPPTLCLDELDWSALPSAPAPELPAPGDRAYVIYTSGSTGRPKGVEIPHGALANFLLSMEREPGFAADDVLLAVTTLSFDIAGLELYLPLITGGRLVLLPREKTWDAEALAAAIEASGATVMQATPATWRLLIDNGWRGSARLKALCGGEALPRELARDLLGHTRELWNMYGPTETTIWSTVDRVDSEDWEVSIGRPIANTQVYVLDARLRPAPIGVAGELYIGGAGVAIGYLNRPELTAERFVPDPFSGVPGARLYRTGDRARVRADGRVEYLGRLDFQVKVRGFRIELGEIEAALEARPGVGQAVVAVHEHSASDKRLVAYVVSEGGAGPDPAELRRALAETLPDYMVPSAFVFLDALPLTPNGKVDRKALPAPESVRREAASEYVEPTGDLERQIATAWRDVLRVERVGKHDNFFDLGGNSLLILQVHSRVKRLLTERDLPVVKMFEHPTVSSLASFMSAPQPQAATLQKANERAAARKKERDARQARRPAE
jgi:amino acid adenylation domain-containing protein